MADPTWEVCVDLNSDGDFADASEDISAYVMEAEWSLGFNRPYQYIPQPNMLKLKLKNTGGLFSPEHGSALANFDKGRTVRVRSTYAATTRTHGFWCIDEINPEPGAKGPRTTRVDCEDWFSHAKNHDVLISTQLSKTADQLITTLIESGGLHPAHFVGWQLGMEGRSNLGVNTYLRPETQYLTLDTGVSTFPYSFDNAKAQSMYQQLRMVVESEQGRIFQNRSGNLEFWSRHHLAKDRTSDQTFSGTMFDLDYEYGSDVVTDVTVKHNPRQLVTAGPYTLATLRSATQVKFGETREIIIRYDDGSGNRISSTTQIDPVATTDYTCHTNSDGTGTLITTNFTITATHTAQASKWKIVNGGTVDGYVDSGATQRGNNKITDFGRVEVRYFDATVQARKPMTVDARLLESSTTAESLARWIVGNRATPRGNSKHVSFHGRSNATILTAALARTIGDRITLVETQTGTNGDYFIIGERHKLARAGKDYRVTWFLEPVTGDHFWQLGVSLLGASTVLAA